jgi:hypothetical protein
MGKHDRCRIRPTWSDSAVALAGIALYLASPASSYVTGGAARFSTRPAGGSQASETNLLPSARSSCCQSHMKMWSRCSAESSGVPRPASSQWNFGSAHPVSDSEVVSRTGLSSTTIARRPCVGARRRAPRLRPTVRSTLTTLGVLSKAIPIDGYCAEYATL